MISLFLTQNKVNTVEFFVLHSSFFTLYSSFFTSSTST